MNTGQMLLTVGAIVLLTLVILRVNNNNLSSDVVLQRSKYGILAVSLATSIIEEASSKAFDEITDSTGIVHTVWLTDVSNLGPEYGETYPDFDDFDDFNDYQINTKGDSTFLSAEFTGFCTVEYVDTTNLDVASASKTWHKKLTVTVTSESMKELYTGEPDTLVMSTIFSYWFYR
ncbi:MAG: hypothetical protein PVH88_09525 [Ignavibacteria bacterium]|jgi:hypothetical protein